MRVLTSVAAFVGMLAFGWLLIGADEAAAQQPSPDQIAAIKSSGRSDFMSKCWGVPRGGSEAFQCLKKNLASLSAPCQQAVQAAIAAATPKAPSAPAAEAKPAAPSAEPAPTTSTAAPPAKSAKKAPSLATPQPSPAASSAEAPAGASTKKPAAAVATAPRRTGGDHSCSAFGRASVTRLHPAAQKDHDLSELPQGS
jgi:hypothetical protein